MFVFLYHSNCFFSMMLNRSMQPMTQRASHFEVSYPSTRLNFFPCTEGGFFCPPFGSTTGSPYTKEKNDDSGQPKWGSHGDDRIESVALWIDTGDGTTTTTRNAMDVDLQTP